MHRFPNGPVKLFHPVLLFLMPLFPLAPVEAVPHAGAVHAWYRADAGLAASDGTVTGWADSSLSPVGKELSRIVGRPRLWKVRSAGDAKGAEAIRSVVRFDGTSALWQPAAEWGRLSEPRTIVLYARFLGGGNGVLLDGSTRSGSDPVVIQASGPGWRPVRVDQKQGALGGFILGADVATKRGIKCDVAEVLVFPRLLTAPEYQQTAAYLTQKWGVPTDLPETEQFSETVAFQGLSTKVLCRNQTAGVHTYRIPGLATSTKGTLLAVFDQRRTSAADLPNDIDVGLMRSTDLGESWEPMRSILDFDAGEPGARGNGVGAPSILVDRDTGRIFVAGLWSMGNRGWNGSGPGFAPSETGQLVLVHSDDDGLSWSAPRNLTPEVKRREWRLCFQGPGRGIQLRNGALVLPAQFREAEGAPRSCLVLSTDHGVTWSISEPAIPRQRPTSEAQVAELSDGSLLLTMRDESRSGKRVWCRFDWNTRTWGEPWLELPDPTCQASLLRTEEGALLFCNPANASARTALTVRTSLDDGKTWSPGRVVDPRPSMYSCMTLLRDGRIGLLYEDADGLVFARFYPEGANFAAIPEGRTETTGKFGWWPARHQKKLRETAETKPELVFLGDSITQNWEEAGAKVWAQFYARRNAANYGFAGDSTQHVLWRIENGELDGLNPRLIVLQIGTNNLRHGNFTPEQIAAGIRAILQRLGEKCPRSRVLLLGIFPRDNVPQGEMRRKGEAVNALLPALADGRRVVYLNINHTFLDPSGVLSDKIAPDQLHLSTRGYQLWAEEMETAVESFLSLPLP